MPKNFSIFNSNAPLRILVRVILFLLFMEGFLNLGGWAFITIQEWRNQYAAHPGAYRILCLGDSITANGGEYSYPSQLQAALNKAFSRGKFQVINKGTPSWTTSEMSAHFKGVLQHYQPDMVILMIGVNDISFYTFVPVNFGQKMKFLVLDRIKVYRLVKNLWKKIRGVDLNLDEKEGGLDEAIVTSTTGSSVTKAAVTNTENGSIQYDIEAPSYYKEITHYHPLTIRNCNDMIETALDKGIKVVVMQYPMVKVDGLKDIIYFRKKVIFIDNEKIFKEAVRYEGFHQYFNDDYGHLSPQGARLLADNLLKNILNRF